MARVLLGARLDSDRIHRGNRYTTRIVVLFLLALVYIGLLQKYRSYDVDNSWFLSFSYNACHGDIEVDSFQEFHYPSGMDGVHLFGKIPAGLQCAVMNKTGWTPGSVLGLNLGVGLLSLWLWWSFLRCLGYRERWIAAFIVLLGVTEPMVSMMEKARYDFLVFFFLALALWLAIQGMELVAALVAILAVEAEPIGVVVVIVVLFFLAMRTKSLKLLALKCGLAGVVIAGLYLQLHPGSIHEMVNSPHPYTQYLLGGTLRTYFIQRRRHLPELAMLLFAGWIYWTERSKIADRNGALLASVMVVVFLFAPHTNVSYMVFVMPFLLWPALEAYDHAKRWRWVPALVFLMILVQYGYLYKQNLHEGFDGRDFASVGERITEAANVLHIGVDQIRVCGDASLWFAHRQNYSSCLSTDPGAAMWRANLFVCLDSSLEENGLSSQVWLSCSKLKEFFPLHELSSMEIRGHLIHIDARR